MIIHALHCLECDSIIFSRSRHDFRPCKCKALAIDGGFDYWKVTYKEASKYESVLIDVPVTHKELYDDWNNEIDNYGCHDSQELKVIERKIYIIEKTDKKVSKKKSMNVKSVEEMLVDIDTNIPKIPKPKKPIKSLGDMVEKAYKSKKK